MQFVKEYKMQFLYLTVLFIAVLIYWVTYDRINNCICYCYCILCRVHEMLQVVVSGHLSTVCHNFHGSCEKSSRQSSQWFNSALQPLIALCVFFTRTSYSTLC